MALFVIDAVQFNAENDQIEKVRWSKVRGGEVSPPAWTATPSIADVAMVAEAIHGGDEVMTLFTTASGTVFGPKVHVVTYADGTQRLEVDQNDTPERSLRDLPTI